MGIDTTYYDYDIANKNNIDKRNYQTAFADETGDCDYECINDYDDSIYNDEFYD